MNSYKSIVGLLVVLLSSMAWASTAYGQTVCPGTTVGISSADSNGSRVYSNCSTTGGYQTMGWSSSVVNIAARSALQLSPTPGAALTIGGFSARWLKSMGPGYRGNCTEVANTGIDMISFPPANDTFCGVVLTTTGEAIYLRGDFDQPTKTMSHPNVVYGFPATAPAAPTGVTATAGNTEATVSWTAPSDGGSAITGYTVTGSPGGDDCATNGATSCTVTGLTNGTAYTFTVVATNGAGTSASSTASNSVTPAAVPDAPTGVTATAGDEEATISWTAPASDGGSAITGYTVTGSPGGDDCATNGATSCTVTGLTNGTAYTFTVVATNAVGNSVASTASASVTPATVPDAPTGVTATAGNAQATVSWTAPASDGGSVITGYTVTGSPGGDICTTTGATSCTVTELFNGIAYTFTVVATNGAGTGAISTASNSVTPAAVPDAPTGITATAGDEEATISWTAPASDGGAAITAYTVTASPGGETCTTTDTTSCTVTGLTNGTAYTFIVVATNTVGTGAPSTASNSVTPTAIDGACGAAQGVASLTAPTVGLCAIGTAGAVTTAGGSHSWKCAAETDGEDAFCSAPGADVADVGGSGNATLALVSGDSCTVSSAELVTPPAGGPAGVELPFGAVDFTVSGCTGTSVTVTVTYPDSVEGMDYWKYINGSWTIMPATLSGNTATITIVDNGPFDADPALGIIRDPGGVGMMDDGAGAGPGSATPIPTLSQWGMILLSLLMAGMALVAMRRRV